jgi:hypothetical protein
MTTTALRPVPESSPRSDVRPRTLDDPAYQVFWLFRIGFTVAPIAFGLDKFFDVLVDWDRYIAPDFVDLFHIEAHTLMYAVGVIGIVAGIVVALWPRFGGYLVAAWLTGVIVNLVIIGDSHDVALRDFGLVLAALTLARLATAFSVRGRAEEITR